MNSICDQCNKEMCEKVKQRNMVTIWIVWWVSEEGDTPEITVFSNAQAAQECWLEHYDVTYECDIDEYKIYPGE